MSDRLPLPVELYGKLADACGQLITVSIPAGGCSAAELRALVGAHDPALALLLAGNRVRACVNDRLVPDAGRIAPGDSVALLPPVSGG